MRQWACRVAKLGLAAASLVVGLSCVRGDCSRISPGLDPPPEKDATVFSAQMVKYLWYVPSVVAYTKIAIGVTLQSAWWVDVWVGGGHIFLHGVHFVWRLALVSSFHAFTNVGVCLFMFLC